MDRARRYCIAGIGTCSRTLSVSAGDKWPVRCGETADWAGPDILFVGFQEINSLNAISVVAGSSMENIDAWNTCIDCALNCKAMPEGYIAAQACSLPTPVHIMHPAETTCCTPFWTFCPEQCTDSRSCALRERLQQQVTSYSVRDAAVGAELL
jgi:hypothetical protein